MKKRNRLLILPLNGASEEEAVKEAVAQLRLIPELKNRWLNIRDMDHEDYQFLVELEDFHRGFASCWLLSSPETIDCFGEDICFEIFEITSKWKDSVWGIDLILYFENIPEEFIVFRGGNGSIEEVSSGHSWTLDIGFARTYADQPHGIVISAQLAKSDILMVITLENEIIPRKGSLTNIKLVNEDPQSSSLTDA